MALVFFGFLVIYVVWAPLALDWVECFMVFANSKMWFSQGAETDLCPSSTTSGGSKDGSLEIIQPALILILVLIGLILILVTNTTG